MRKETIKESISIKETINQAIKERRREIKSKGGLGMTRYKPFMVRVLLVLGFAVGAAANAEWHEEKVESIYPQGDGSFSLSFESDHASCTNANTPKHYYVAAGQNGVSAAGVEHMLSVALTAASTGKQINIEFDETVAECYVSRLSVRF